MPPRRAGSELAKQFVLGISPAETPGDRRGKVGREGERESEKREKGHVEKEAPFAVADWKRTIAGI